MFINFLGNLKLVLSFRIKISLPREEELERRKMRRNCVVRIDVSHIRWVYKCVPTRATYNNILSIILLHTSQAHVRAV